MFLYVPGIRKLVGLGRRLLVLHPAGEAADYAGQPQGLDLLPGAGSLHGPLAVALQGSAQVDPGSRLELRLHFSSSCAQGANF